MLHILPAIVVSAVLNFVGLVVNFFIAMTNYRTWVQSHRISSSDRILLSLAITRFLTLGISLVDIVYWLLPNSDGSVSVLASFLLCWMGLDCSSLWFVTLLNVLYCVKISNLRHSVFLLLKHCLSAKTLRLLLACVLISALSTLLYAGLAQTLPFPEAVTGSNGTEWNSQEGILSFVLSLFLSSFLQFIINVTSASLLIHSLRRHVQTMQRNASGLWNPKTEAHVGAMKLMVYFLLLYIPYYVAALSLHLPSNVGLGLGTRSLCMVISAVYHPGHSVLIVLTHPKLKTKAKKILCLNK